jgi:hypothetical protein
MTKGTFGVRWHAQRDTAVECSGTQMSGYQKLEDGRRLGRGSEPKRRRRFALPAHSKQTPRLDSVESAPHNL